MERIDAPEWRLAMEDEMNQFKEHEVFELVKLEPWMHVIGGKWVFAYKRNETGQIVKHKARYVAKGFTQKYNIDYKETFSPTSISSSVKVILSIIASEDLICHQMDVSTAFLHGDLDVDIYMNQPEGFEDSTKPNHVVRLKKGLYGLKQAGRIWNLKMNDVLMAANFNRSITDETIYIRDEGDSKTYIVLYVDDLLIAGNSLERVNNVKDLLNGNFKMKDLGEANMFIGIKITRNRMDRKLFLDQSRYIRSVLDKYRMADCNPYSSPAHHNEQVGISSAEPFENPSVYQSAVGALNWIAINTRPDISAAVGAASQHVQKPSIQDWQSVKRIMHYLQGTTDMALSLGGSPITDNLKVHVDANWAGNSGKGNTKTSRQGCIIQFAGGVVSWYSRLQSVPALSSTEAEYVSLSAGIKELISIRNLLSEIGLVLKPSIVYEDNAAVIFMVKNQTLTRNTRHIDLRHHHIRYHFNNDSVQIQKISTTENMADILTKDLQGSKLAKFRKMMGIIPLREGVSISGN